MRRRTSIGSAIVVLALVAVVASDAVSASASPGDLDTFFSNDGIQTAFANGAVAKAVAIDRHERIVLAGYTLGDHPDIALARFTPSGALDTTFGGDGRVVTDLGANDYAFDLAIQTDGGIVVAGQRSTPSSSRAVVQRYNPNGALDAGFGRDGTVFTGFGRRFQSANAVAIAPSGRIVIAGSTSNGTASRSALARYLVDGHLDRSFGGDGRVTTDVSRSAEQFTDVGIAPDGRVVASGWAELGLVPAFAAARYTVDGRLDDTFDGDGIAHVDVSGGADKATAAALQPDGKLILVGVAGGGWGIVRLDPRGHLDGGFSVGGILVNTFGVGYDEAGAVIVQPNGRIVVAGRIRAGAKDDIGVLRLKSAGRHDLTFGAGGRVLTDVAGGSDAAHGLALQTDGKIVVAGEAAVDGIRRFAVARYRRS